MAVMDPALELAYRNRMSLAPAQRAAVEQAYAAALAAHEDSYYGREPAPAAETSPADLDPVEAAATPLTPDPVVQPRARTAEIAPPGIGLPEGFSEFSAGMAEAETGKTRAERIADADAMSARQDQQLADYYRSTGMSQPSGLAANDGYRDWSGWQPGDPVPEAPRMGPTALESARADQTASRLDAIEAKYGPEARAIAERGDAEGVTDYDAVKTPREKQKNAYRREQEWAARMQGAEQDAAGNFLSPARADIRAQDERQATSNKAFRARVAAAPRSQQDPRMQQWIAQSMLAGGQPTGGPRGTKAVANAFLMMNDPSLSEEQQQSLRYMLPGGALAAQVDARQLDMAAGLARQAITGALAGTAQGPMAAAQAELAQLQAQAERDKLRGADEDVLGEKYAPTGWLGYDEFTIAEQQQMYDDLIAQGYKQAEAQRAVDRQARKRRATDKQRWSDAGA